MMGTPRVYTDNEMLTSLQWYNRRFGSSPTWRAWNALAASWVWDVPVAESYRYRFGSWSGALLRAGLTPNNVGRRKQAS